MIPDRNNRRCARRLPRWIAMIYLAVTVVAQGQEQTYVVKRNDTLYGLARRYGLSVSELANRNGISRHSQVYVGQRLLIPSNSSPPSKPELKLTTSLLSQTVQKAVDNAPVSPRRWKYIVIHHSGAEEGSLKSIDRYHREERHMENGLAYHFLIGNGNGMGDGEIAVGNRWKE